MRHAFAVLVVAVRAVGAPDLLAGRHERDKAAALAYLIATAADEHLVADRERRPAHCLAVLDVAHLLRHTFLPVVTSIAMVWVVE